MTKYDADTYERAVAAAISRKDLVAAVSLMRRMAVEHPHRAERLLNEIQATLDELAGVSG